MKHFRSYVALHGLFIMAIFVAMLQAQGPSTSISISNDPLAGCSTSYITSAASTNATLIAGVPGNICGYSLVNTTATIYYLRMYNLASIPTCSSATGFVESIPIPASTSGAGIQRTEIGGQAFSTGMSYCLTGAGASTDNSNAATGVYISIRYKR